MFCYVFRKESATIRAVFPYPNVVMSILVQVCSMENCVNVFYIKHILVTHFMSLLSQRVMEDRIPSLLEKLLVKPSLLHPPPTKQGGLLLVSTETGCICSFSMDE